jgi:hypothetical protein
MSDTRAPSAEKVLVARSRDGEEWELQIKVWPPLPSTIAPWSCKVEVTRLFTPAKDVYGEDSWQAQYMAMRFATSLLEHFVQQGGILYWPEAEPEKPREQFSVKDLLPPRAE